MFFHISNLIHLGIILCIWVGIEIYLRRTTATRFRAAMRLLQILPFLFITDLVVGFVAVEEIYGTHQGASWIAKTLWIYPGLFLISIWRMVRARRAERALDSS